MSPAFDISGTHGICARVPYALQVGIPDDHSANRRKKQHLREQLPQYCFGLDSRCPAHMVHRIVEGRYKPVCGDIHAVWATTTHVSHSNRILRAVQDIISEDLDNGNLHRAAPDPECLRMNRAMLNHTVLRRQTVTTEEDDVPWLGSAATALETCCHNFLACWNGRWHRPVCEHWCLGACGPTPQHCKDNMFGTLVAIDLLMAKDDSKPSMDDWHSFGIIVGKVSGGASVHQLLQRVLSRALPSYTVMVGPSGPAGGPNEQRLKIVKKAWRSKKFLADPVRLYRAMVVCFIGISLEALQAHLMHGDSRQNSLWDIVFEDKRNPFVL